MNDILARLRELGWMVAVHNDYRINNKRMTFWLFTHPDGRWVKGEGQTDNEALGIIRKTLRERGTGSAGTGETKP